MLSSAGAQEFNEALAGSEEKTVRTALAVWFLRQEGRTDAELEEACYDQDDEVRMSAVQVLVGRQEAGSLEGFLSAYRDRGRPYRYNVICYLDEHLYGPASPE